MAKIKKIKLGDGDALDICDAEAVHQVKTYNGGKTLVGTGDVSLADTPIENSEIDTLFANSNN